MDVPVPRVAEAQYGDAEPLPHGLQGADQGGDGGPRHYHVLGYLQGCHGVERLGKHPPRLPQTGRTQQGLPSDRSG